MISVTTIAKALAPVALIGAGMIGANWLHSTAPVLERQQVDPTLPLVEVLPVQIRSQRLDVSTHGELAPQNMVQLAAEVSARVIWTSKQWQDGAYFHAGEALLKLDPVDYQLSVATAEAKVAQAKAALQVEQAEADAALLDWQEHGQGDAPALVAREPQLAMAGANLSAAQASLAQANRALDRCTIHAPIDGRVMQANAEIGQFVGAGSVVGSIYDSSSAEIRLPIQTRELAWLDLPLNAPALDLNVKLHGTVGGESHQWHAKAVATEASLDPRNRMLTVVAQVDDPFALRKSSKHAPLVPGMFLQATLQGRDFPSIATLPRAVLREDDTVLVVDAQNRIQIRKVEVLRSGPLLVHLRGGIENGERICATPLTAVTEGMEVRVASAEAKEGEQAGAGAGK
jgi:RND family efflux transporter MFP subunit